MDIIAAHQQGLMEQLDEGVRVLAGRPRDHEQRAVVLHHMFDHSSSGHVWALAEARRALLIVERVERLERRLGRWGWLLRRRSQARDALKQLVEALGEAARQRCVAAYRAYRLSAAPALRSEAERTLSSGLLVALENCHAARRAGEPMTSEAKQDLAEESERLAEVAMDHAALDAAWVAIDATGLKRVARRLLGAKALARATVRDERRGRTKVERALRNDPALPAAFRANPAQHFYALQHGLAERRRQQWREECDREPDAFELAA
jgi:hypothetical protein